MPEKSARDKAIEKIYSLRKLAEHPNTGDGERAAALEAIKRLQAKHDIKPAQERKEQPTGPRNPNFRQNDQAARDHADRFRRTWQHMASARRRTEEQLREEARKRQEAQARYRERMADKDDMGRPLTEAEREWARRDPLGFAATRDQRTRAERNADLGAAWGQQGQYVRDREPYVRTQQGPRRPQEHPKAKPTPPPPLKRCEKPESFFDSGGNPRKRNDHPIQCDRCSVILKPGEGMVFKVGDRWFGRCCEARPGPRRKRF